MMSVSLNTAMCLVGLDTLTIQTTYATVSNDYDIIRLHQQKNVRRLISPNQTRSSCKEQLLTMSV